MYSLKGDRKIEQAWIGKRVPMGDGYLLDVGPGPRFDLTGVALRQGWTVIALDIRPLAPKFSHERFTFVHEDLNTVKLPYKFGCILNLSSIEHFGLPGRYGIEKLDIDADLRGMKRLHSLMTDKGQMLMTVPVGHDALFVPYHRVYGVKRLPLLLEGFRVIKQEYWNKINGIDTYRKCSRQEALDTEPLNGKVRYYAIGAMILEKELNAADTISG